MRTARYVVMALLAVGCGDPFGPQAHMPPGAIEFVPDTVYATLWKEMERCSEISAPMNRVTWLYYPGTKELPGRGVTHFAAWHVMPHTIYFAELFLPDIFIVRHEMLHDLLQRHGHPPEYFGKDGRCGYELGLSATQR